MKIREDQNMTIGAHVQVDTYLTGSYAANTHVNDVRFTLSSMHLT